MFNPASPLGFLSTLLELHVRKARSERGASAVEWVIIAGLVLGIVLLVGGLLESALNDKATDVGEDIRQ